MTSPFLSYDPESPESRQCGPQSFSLGGEIAGVRATTPQDDVHPALMLVVDVGCGYVRVLVPPAVWPVEPELLRVGQWVSVQGDTDSGIFIYGSRQVATRVSLVVRCH